MAEVEASIALIKRALMLLPDGPLRADCDGRRRTAKAWAGRRSPRGTLFYAVHFGDDGKLARVKIKSPSFSNWRVFPVHRARQQHDGLRDQRGELRPDHRGLRQVGGSACRYGHCWACCKANRPRLGRWPRATTGRPASSACRAISPNLRRRLRGLRRRLPDRRRSPCGADGDGRLEIDYGRCVVCQLCTEACPTGAMATSSDWAFGVRARATTCLESGCRPRRRSAAKTTTRLPPQPACPPRRCRLLQRLRVRAAGAEQPVLQPASARHLLHRLAALCRPAAGDRPGDARHARPAARHLRGDGGAALGDGGRHLRGVRRHCRGRLCLRPRARRRAAGRRLSARLPAQSGGGHRRRC